MSKKEPPITATEIERRMKMWEGKKIFDMGRLNIPLPKIEPLIPSPLDQPILNLTNSLFNDILSQARLFSSSTFAMPGTASQINPDLMKTLNRWWNKPPDEESRFERDWRSQMSASWKGWSQSDINKNFAKIWIDEGKGILCARFPYHQKAIDEFKEKIPKGKKAWNAEDKLWEFSVETIDVVVDILTRNFDEVIDMTQAVPTTSVVVSGDPFLSLLDKDDIQAIYRILAKKYHPDRGGDEGKMARINQIFSQIK